MGGKTGKSDSRSRTSLRLDPKIWKAIDAEIEKRPGTVSHNTWIIEAIMEKLEREKSSGKKGASS